MFPPWPCAMVLVPRVGNRAAIGQVLSYLHPYLFTKSISILISIPIPIAIPILYPLGIAGMRILFGYIYQKN